MADLKPFKGYRPTAEYVKQVASPPYDVLSSAEAREMAKTNKYTFLHVVKPEIDLPVDTDVHGEEVYNMGAKNLKGLINDKILVRDESPCFYLYRQKMGDHVQTGLVAGSSVSEYKNNLIKKHEHTRKEKEDDRARHVEILNANTGPVFLTYHHVKEIDDFFGELTKNDPEFDFIADDGIQHVLWKVENEADVNKIKNLFKEVPALYVADGHHRSAAAMRVQERMEKEKANASQTGNETYNHFLTVIFPDDQMFIMDYNRCVKDLNGLEPDAIINEIKKCFDVNIIDSASAEDAKPKTRGQFAMYLDGSWYNLKVKSEFVPDDPVTSLDTSILQNNVLDPVLGIDDPRTNNRIDFVGGIRGLKELVRRCEVDCKIAFALYPTGIEQLLAVADAGKVMPPKSTWFEPKLRSGVVVRTLDE